MKIFTIVDKTLLSSEARNILGVGDKDEVSTAVFSDDQSLKKWRYIHEKTDIIMASPSGLIFVRRGEDVIPVKMIDIAGVSTGGDVVVIHMRDGHEILGDHTLKEYEEILNPLSFIRISRQWIINVYAIIKLSCSVLGNGHVYLEPDLDIVLSREKYSQVVKLLTD